ncbi:hypothetical protein LTR09_009038 [Extremus antarcticus]|uniref:RING-type domain-containing protein n=1 Tax=Extremus antarcticus TaxID=702011 RepID=A0AAJ0D9I3_9PEZI|nr:hypothetical protein LTR09_009038 [Extremus antarcticus]
MSATSLRVLTAEFPDPQWASSTDTIQQVNSSISYWALPSPAPVTLSTTNANPGSDLTGLLYYPDLPPNDACNDAAAPYVPKNVTRRSNLPVAGYDVIAVAPWLSPDCVQKYLRSARRTGGRAFIFFLPDNSTMPVPGSDDPTWALGDGENWKRENPYPVYAIPGTTGNELLYQSSLYSGNVTDVPHGQLLTETGVDPRNYVRLFVDISTGGGTALPSLWVFLLVVLGILLGIIGCTSLSMHILQRRRRIALRRRVATGEVDLEALGIKRLTVPQEVLDKMPLYTYGSGAPVAHPSTARDGAATTPSEPTTTLAESKLSTSTSSRPSSPFPNIRPTPTLIRGNSYHPSPLQQPTCAICLDDFVPGTPDSPTGTIVRELPCHHIFHPECVDAFLRDSSSLCPMCKKSALPKGYCPRVVTNAMVRRERMMRGLQPDAAGDVESGATAGEEGVQTRRRSMMMSWGGQRRFFSAPSQEMQAMDAAGSGSTTRPPPPAATRTGMFGTSLARERRSVTQPLPTQQSQPVQPPSNPSRREWARERAVAMLGRDRAPVDPDAEEAMRTPRWRKVLQGVFPNMGGGRAS